MNQKIHKLKRRFVVFLASMRAPTVSAMNKVLSSANREHRRVSMKFESMAQVNHRCCRITVTLRKVKNSSRKSARRRTAVKYSNNTTIGRHGSANSVCPTSGSIHIADVAAKVTCATMGNFLVCVRIISIY